MARRFDDNADIAIVYSFGGPRETYALRRGDDVRFAVFRLWPDLHHRDSRRRRAAGEHIGYVLQPRPDRRRCYRWERQRFYDGSRLRHRPALGSSYGPRDA